MSAKVTLISGLGTFLVLAMCDQWFGGPDGERVPIDECCQLWMPVSFAAETDSAQMQPLREWDPLAATSEGGSQPPGSVGTVSGRPGRPRMYFADAVSGRPYSKDPAVVKLGGRYWLYYSLPPYEGKPTRGWSIGVAASDNLVDWSKVGELRNTGDAEENGFCAPGAIVLDGRVHLFYQTYGNARRDAICHAWSEDGIHFTRNPTNPVFRPTGDWNCGRAIDADVIEHGDRLLLYWATRDPDFKIQMQGVAAAPLESDFGRNQWTQLNLDGPILKPELPWEGRCIEAAAMAKHGGRLYMFYAGSYNNQPQQVGVAVSDDGVHFARLFDEPFLPAGPPGSWNSSESGHPFLFQDDDGRDYLFYQGNNDKGRTWYLSVMPIDWKDGKPVLAPNRLGYGDATSADSPRRSFTNSLGMTMVGIEPGSLTIGSTEAEWEYACRAGTTTAFHTGQTLPETHHRNQPVEGDWNTVRRRKGDDLRAKKGKVAISLAVGTMPPRRRRTASSI